MSKSDDFGRAQENYEERDYEDQEVHSLSHYSFVCALEKTVEFNLLG